MDLEILKKKKVSTIRGEGGRVSITDDGLLMSQSLSFNGSQNGTDKPDLDHGFHFTSRKIAQHLCQLTT